MKKILFATIVPFWNRATGAQQRIFSLVKVLEAHGHQVRVFFPAHTDPSDQQTAQALGLDVAFERSDQAPAANQSLSQKIKWQIDAVKHAVSNLGAATDQNGPLRLSDFRWPWAEVAFKDAVIEFAPDAIVCEYITMAYLVESLPADLRSKIHCFVDTHDLLSRRQQEFADHDRRHWITVSPEEEAAALSAFDTIVAIQEDEAAVLKTMAPESAVIVVGHQTLVADEMDAKTQNDSEVITIGYLGSNNASNVDAINQFLDIVWRNFQDDPRGQLVLAGSASDEVPASLRFQNVTCLGSVDDVSDFYTQVDGVINPVGYGTGLKIKSVEAIAYGKPLLCTPTGWVGRPIGGVTVVDQVQEMTGVIKQWFDDRESFERISLAAFASSQMSADQIYRPLLDLL